jgi:hypothetical protein
MARGKMSIPSSSDNSSSDDEGEGKPSVDELVEAIKFLYDVCTKQKAQLKTLKTKLISSRNDYKGLLQKFEKFVNLNCELSTKIEQLKPSAASTATDDGCWNLQTQSGKLKWWESGKWFDASRRSTLGQQCFSSSPAMAQ